MDELDHISRVALLIDDLNNEDPNAKLHSITRLTQIAQLLGIIYNFITYQFVQDLKDVQRN